MSLISLEVDRQSTFLTKLEKKFQAIGRNYFLLPQSGGLKLSEGL
jgi:hypothetical protein